MSWASGFAITAITREFFLLIDGVPVAGITAWYLDRLREFAFGNEKLVGLTGADSELASSAADYVASYRVFKKAMPEAVAKNSLNQLTSRAQTLSSRPSVIRRELRCWIGHV